MGKFSFKLFLSPLKNFTHTQGLTFDGVYVPTLMHETVSYEAKKVENDKG